MAFDEAHRVYGETIADAIRRSRSGVEAQALGRVELEEVVEAIRDSARG